MSGIISLCIIAKNEENNIGKCIGSCKHFVDEIIVVDTGSTDDTIKIAKSFGAKVINHFWENNFAKARNVALDYAKSEWILYLDCDETIDFQGGIKLKKALKSDLKEGECEGLCLNLINIIDNKMTSNYISLRVFRNKKNYRFRGMIHEQIFPSIGEKYNESVIKSIDVNFFHFGYDEKKFNIKEKIKRNLTIFENYPYEERNGFYYYNLGNEYTRIGDKQKALTNYLLARSTPAYDNGFKVFLPIYIVKCYYELKKYREAIDMGLEYLKIYTKYKDLNFFLAMCYYEVKEYKNCKYYLLEYIKLKGVNYGYPEFYLDKENDIENILKFLDYKISINE